MKILKIRFENIHSLKGYHEVNFENGPLAEAGLFAITGPTGSGKSTLLDVITLALYNRIARVGKTVSNAFLEDDGGVMTRNMKHCSAEVDYRVNGMDYRSHWSIERNRNNNLNPRKQELVLIETGQILETGTKTPEINEKIIGLNYDQFIKAMVLSQGEFSKLLQASRNDRNRLLEDITGARSYREIGRAVFMRYKDIEKNIELQEAGLKGIALLSPEQVSENKTELKALFIAKPKLEKNFQAATDQIKTRRELQQKQEEWASLESEKQKYKADYEIFEPYQARLKTHDKLSRYSDLLRQYDAESNELAKIGKHRKELQNSRSEVETQQKSYLETIALLIKEPVESTTANLKLEAFRNHINTLQVEEKKKHDEAILHQTQLNNYVANINALGHSLTKAVHFEVFEPQFKSLHGKVQGLIRASGLSSLEQLETDLSYQRLRYEKAAECLVKKDLDLKLTAKLKTLQEELVMVSKQRSQDVKNIAVLEVEISTLKKDIETLEARAEQQLKFQSLEQHREHLHPDEPCPLCGSVNHPYAEHRPHFDVKAELLKEKKDALLTKSNFAISLTQKNKFQDEKIASLEKEIREVSAEYGQNRPLFEALIQQLQWPDGPIETLQNLRETLNNAIQAHEQLQKAFQADRLFQGAVQSLTSWQKALEVYRLKRQEREQRYKNDDINLVATTLASRINQSIASQAAIDKQLQDSASALKLAMDDQAKTKQNLDQILKAEQLDHIEQLKKAILPEETALRIRKQQSILAEKSTRLSEQESSLQKQLKQLNDQDDPKLSLETLTSTFETLKLELDALLVNLGKITQRLEDNQRAHERQQKVLEKLNLLKKDLELWKTMNDLIGDATGNKFSNFVQDLTLEQLIGFANKRLLEFSDRYLLDIPTAHEAEKSDTLKIIDGYMGNVRRSVRTLSGGETFLVSLAMAFALSDIASRNVSIESLFIDEGFGTLDPETLDQAITILEKMQNEGDKSVGIISHVSALKERITTQIKLEKGNLGYSTFTVIQ